jgi:hypothetical protein
MNSARRVLAISLHLDDAALSVGEFLDAIYRRTSGGQWLCQHGLPCSTPNPSIRTSFTGIFEISNRHREE